MREGDVISDLEDDFAMAFIEPRFAGEGRCDVESIDRSMGNLGCKFAGREVEVGAHEDDLFVAELRRVRGLSSGFWFGGRFGC